MRLQTDPSVIYGITRAKETLGQGLRASELTAITPYNTYAIVGLPPTPIANPGKAAIEAVANPPATDMLYFVADGSGGHNSPPRSRTITAMSRPGARSRPRRRLQDKAADPAPSQ